MLHLMTLIMSAVNNAMFKMYLMLLFTLSHLNHANHLCSLMMGYCFGSISLFVYFFVNKITRKRLDWFAWNFQGRCEVTMGQPGSILGQFGETARCQDANFFVSICQHYEQMAGAICMKLSWKMWWPWDDLITFLVNSEKPRDAAMCKTGAEFVVLSHHNLFRNWGGST